MNQIKSLRQPKADNPIQSNPIHVNPSISKKSLMVAQPSLSKLTRKGAQKILYNMEAWN